MTLRRRSESGFAMLLVFAMAASVAILLYMELPRLVFESQRVKEQTLIDRGEQYRRAIQLYVRKYKKYPASVDELEKSGAGRFLRRRYKDPMTGKDEWRLIHIDAAGAFTDSLLHKPPEKEGEKKSENTFITEGAAFGSTGPPPGQEQGGPGGPRGASDRPAVSTASGVLGQAAEGVQPPYPPQGQPYPYPQQQQQQQQPQQTQPQYPYPQPVQVQPGQNVPYLVPGLPFPVPQPGQQAGQQPGQQPSIQPQPYPYPQPGQVQPYPAAQPPQYPPPPPQSPAGQPYPGYPTTPASSQTGGLVPVPYTGRPGSPGGSTVPAQGQNAALDLIRNLLTTPRPGGLQGNQSAAGGQVIGGGIAGVATTLEAEGIKVYNERTKYNEWEFLYDIRQDQTAFGGAAGFAQQPGQPQQLPLNQPQQPGPLGQPQQPGLPLQPGLPQQPGQPLQPGVPSPFGRSR